jgi:hypothetical protein
MWETQWTDLQNSWMAEMLVQVSESLHLNAVAVELRDVA